MKKYFNLRVTLLMCMLIGYVSYSGDLMFTALDDFGAVNLYLASLVVVIQRVFFSMVIIGLISDIFETVAQADFARLIRSAISAMFYMMISTALIKIIVRMSGLQAKQGSVAVAGDLVNQFSYIFKFLSVTQYGMAYLILATGILFFIVGMFKYAANHDITQLIISLITTALFLTAFLRIVVIGFDIKSIEDNTDKSTFTQKIFGRSITTLSASELGINDIIIDSQDTK